LFDVNKMSSVTTSSVQRKRPATFISTGLNIYTGTVECGKK